VRLSVFSAVLYAAAVIASASHASAGDTPLADKMFREGQELLRAGRIPEACVRFQKSMAEDPQLGTLLNLAFCHEKANQPGKAWIEYRDAESRAASVGNKDREKFARDHRLELEKELMRCKVEGPPLPKEVRVDGDRVAKAETGEPFFVEPGLRKFGFVDKDGHVSVRDTLVQKGPFIQVLHAPAQTETDKERDKASVDKTTAAPPGPPWPWIAYGVGAAGLAVGATFGLLSLDKLADARRDPQGTSKDDAKTMALISDIGWITLVAGAATGTLLLLYPSDKPASVGSQSSLRVDTFGTGMRLTATF